MHARVVFLFTHQCNNDGVMPIIVVMPLVSDEFIGHASNCHTTFALLLLPVHVKDKRKAALAKTSSLLLKCFKFMFAKNSWPRQSADATIKIKTFGRDSRGIKV